MLYLKLDITADTRLGIWKIDESAEDLALLLTEKQWLQDDVFTLKSPKRIIERLAVRVLLRELLQDECRIFYHPSGKPYLTNGYNISISHTDGYVAVLLSKSNICGVDIEHFSEQVRRVKNRFVSDKEYLDKNTELQHLLLHWSAKETVYKIVDDSTIILKEDAKVYPFGARAVRCVGVNAR